MQHIYKGLKKVKGGLPAQGNHLTRGNCCPETAKRKENKGMKVLLSCFYLILASLLISNAAFSQSVTPCSTAVNFYNFEVEGTFRANSMSPQGDDWFVNGAGPGVGVIGESAATATPPISAAAFRSLIESAAGPVERNKTYQQRMAFPYSTLVGTNVLLDAVAARDHMAAGPAVDSTTFLGSSKNYHNPILDWGVGAGNAQNKNDIIDAGGHLRLSLVDGHLIGYAFASTLSTSGDAHTDFEIFRTLPVMDVVNDTVTNTGPLATGGHTAGYFNPDGSVKSPGDVLVSVDYLNGGTNPTATVRIWVDPNNVDSLGNDTAWLNQQPNRPFTFTGLFEGGPTNTNGFGYAEIRPNVVSPANCLFISVVNSVQAPASAWGSLSGSTADFDSTIQVLQNVEVAIDFTAFGLDINPLQGECFILFGSLLVKTRSSGSWDANMADYAGPYDFGNVQTIDAFAGADTAFDCQNPTLTLNGSSATPGASYLWTVVPGSGGHIVSGETTLNPVIDSAGCYILTVSNPTIATCTASDTVCVTGSADLTGPEITCPPDISEECAEDVPACYANYAAFIAGGGTASDPKSGILASSYSCRDSVVVAGECGGIIIRIHSVADSCGNVSSCHQTINIDDETAPTFDFVPANTTVECDATPVFGDPTASDNCDDVVDISIVSTTTAPTANCAGGTTTRTWVATDECGNTATASQTLTFVDSEAPVFDAPPADITVQCDAVPQQATLTASDNCDDNVTVTPASSITPGSCPDSYIIHRSWTATDDCGNTATVAQNVTVIDDTAPQLSGVPANVTVQCNAVPGPASPSATDNCNTDVDISYAADTLAGNCPDAYLITRTWTATDNCGNTATASQTLNVVDTQAPVLDTPPANVTVQCDAVPTQANLSASDNCDDDVTVVPSQDITPGNCEDSYLITRTWTATDDCGNTSTVTQTLNVVDTQAPVFDFIPQNTTVNCDETPNFGTPTATDNCDSDVQVDILSTDPATTANCAGGIITRIWVATDNCGNTATASQVLTIVDTEAPVFDAPPADITVQCDNVPQQATLTASDNCDDNVTVTPASSITPGSCPDSYIIHRSWTATDDCGNTATVAQNVTVIDDTAPQLSGVPANVTVQCNAVPGPASPSAIDNCDTDVDISYAADTLAGNCPDAYLITRTWTATDNCGNTATASQTLNVVDTQAPVLDTPPANVTVQCDAVPPQANLSASDNCDDDVTVVPSQDITPGNCEDSYLITRTWTATDDCGNTSTVTQTLNVVDTQAPVFDFIPQNTTVNCDETPNFGTPTATDNCDSDVQVDILSTDPATTANCAGGIITRIWVATDNCGNTATASQVLTIVDTEAPVFDAPPADITVQCDNVPPQDVLTASDNCDTDVTVTPASSITPGSCPDSYIIHRSWTATDNCGNTATVAQNVTVIDDTAPQIYCPADITVTCAEDVPAANASDATATDNCSTPLVEVAPDVIGSYVCSNRYTVERVYTATDDCGNTASCTQYIYVYDDVAPQITCPADITVACAEDVPPAYAYDAYATDNCAGIVDLSVAPDDISGFTCDNRYVIARVYTATDVCGNTASCTQYIYVYDDVAPQITCPADITVTCAEDVPPANAYDAYATDNCYGLVDISVAPDDISGFTCDHRYVIARVYTATDVCGNTASCTQYIYVYDDVAPQITCPADITVACAEDVPPANANDAWATDNCYGIVDLSVAPDDISGFTCDHRYVIARVYTATDVCGNTASCTQYIYVYDDVAPQITCPADVTVECASDVPAPDANDAWATDNCYGLVDLSVAPDQISNQTCDNRYTITRVYTATDVCGNTASCTQYIYVYDDTPPSITCPADITVECASDVPAANPRSCQASDNCGGLVTVTAQPDIITNQDCANRYTISRVYVATDACGNTATCVQYIYVYDDTPPSISCPADITVECASDVPAPNTNLCNTSDNCGGTVTVTVLPDEISNQECANRYTIKRVYVATDLCGNTATCAQYIYVYDDTPPSISCPANITVECASDVPAPNTNLCNTSDNCGGTVTVTVLPDEISNQECANRYTIKRVYVATDVCGNTSTCAQYIYVYDDTPPSISCPANITVECASDVPAPNTNLCNTSDNCGGTVTVTVLPDEISNQACANRYTIKRVYVATDLCGNIATCAQYIYVYDDTPPSITCPDDITVECASDVPAPNTNLCNTSDNCGGTVTVTVLPDEISNQSCANRYTIKRVYVATDACGNTATCAQYIDVYDDTPPSISCPANVTVECASDVPAADPRNCQASDNCGGVTVTVLPDEISNQTCDNRYTIKRVYVATDVCGNTATCAQYIYVYDDTPPSISCPANVTVKCAGDVPAPNTNLCNTSDNCGGDVIVTVEPDYIYGQVCVNRYYIRRVYVATDDCGNTATCSQIIKVWDDVKPVVISTPPGANLGCNPAGLPPPVDPVATDNCGSVTITSELGLVTINGCNRTQKRIYTISDGCNYVTRAQVFTWKVDVTPPVFTYCPPNVTLACNATTIPAPGTPTATDDCCNPRITSTLGSVITNGCYKSRIRTYKATDNCGNTATCTQVYTWRYDRTPPTISCPSNIVRGECNNVVYYSINASDNCSGTPNIVVNPPSGTAFPVGNTTVTVTATDSCGNIATRTFTVTIKPNPTCALPTNIASPVTGSTGNQITATNSSNVVAWKWTVSGGASPWLITGGSTSKTVTYTAGSGCATFKLVVTNAQGCKDSCYVDVCAVAARICTYTQGGYGQAGGTHCNGQQTPAFVTGLLNQPLVIGGGNNKLTLTAADVANGCFFTRLPGGGASVKLNGIATCANPVGITLNGSKFKNTLLAQTIVLGLNLRILNSQLEGVVLSGQYLTTYASTGSGCDDPNATIIPGTGQTWVLPASVIAELGANNTVADLYLLANRALAGTYVQTAGHPSLTDIGNAVDKINNAFHGCRIFGSCTSSNGSAKVEDQTKESVFTELSMSAYPNPFSAKTTIEFMLNGFDSDVTIEVYTLSGTKVASIFNGHVEADQKYSAEFDGSNLPTGVYIYRLNAGDKMYNDRLVLIK